MCERITRLLALLFVAALVAMVPRTAHPLNFETILVSDEQAPGVPLGGRVRSFLFPPTIDGQGGVAFRAQLRTGFGGVTPWSDIAAWATDESGVLQLIAREGFQAKGAPMGAVFEVVASPVLNRLGDGVVGARGPTGSCSCRTPGDGST